MVLENMINMQLMMFLLVALGFWVRKKEIIGGAARKQLVDFCLYITLPFNIFHSFQLKWEQSMLLSFLEILLMSVGYNLISIGVSYASYRKIHGSRKSPLRYGTIVSNGGFLGNPVIEGIYGSQGVFYASVFMLPVRIVMWTIGSSCYMNGKEKHLFKKVMTHPCIVSIYLGMLVMIAGIEFPTCIANTIEKVSNCNTPISMMLVGMMLAEMDMKRVKTLLDKTLVYYVFMRLIGIGAILYGVTFLLPVDPLLKGVTVIIAGMPTPITTALLASKYDGDEDYATAMIFVTTILSLVTLPLWCLIL